MVSHSIQQKWHSRLCPSQINLVIDLATLVGCKAVWTWLAGDIPRWYIYLKMVTHPWTSRALCRMCSCRHMNFCSCAECSTTTPHCQLMMWTLSMTVWWSAHCEWIAGHVNPRVECWDWRLSSHTDWTPVADERHGTAWQHSRLRQCRLHCQSVEYQHWPVSADAAGSVSLCCY